MYMPHPFSYLCCSPPLLGIDMEHPQDEVLGSGGDIVPISSSEVYFTLTDTSQDFLRRIIRASGKRGLPVIRDITIHVLIGGDRGDKQEVIIHVLIGGDGGDKQEETYLAKHVHVNGLC